MEVPTILNAYSQIKQLYCQINPNADKIKGVICGVRVEEIYDPLTQKIRWLNKLVDKLAKGKAMEKVLRS